MSRLRLICCCFSILIAGAVGESRPLENGSDPRVCLHPVERSHSCDSINNKKSLFFWGGDLIRLLVWSFSPSTHDARCYSSHCVCSHNICHKCSLCNRNSQSGLPPSCLPLLPLFRDLYLQQISFRFWYQPWLLFFWHLMILMCFLKPAWGLIPDLCQLLTASVYSGNYYVAVCLQLVRVSVFPFLTSVHSTDCLSPPLSHRFQLYLQTTWLVTSMLRRCRSLSINGTCCSCCETVPNQWKHKKRVGVAFLICPLVVNLSTVHKLFCGGLFIDSSQLPMPKESDLKCWF